MRKTALLLSAVVAMGGASFATSQASASCTPVVVQDTVTFSIDGKDVTLTAQYPGCDEDGTPTVAAEGEVITGVTGGRGTLSIVENDEELCTDSVANVSKDPIGFAVGARPTDANEGNCDINAGFSNFPPNPVGQPSADGGLERTGTMDGQITINGQVICFGEPAGAEAENCPAEVLDGPAARYFTTVAVA